MSLVFSKRSYPTPRSNDQELVKQLTDLIRQNVPYSKRLDVLGILSYTTDNGCEKFIKIDSSFSVSNEGAFEKLKKSSDYSSLSSVKISGDCSSTKTEVTDDYSQNIDAEQHSSTHSPGASPPLLPPSVIQVSRVGRADERSDTNGFEHISVTQSSDKTQLVECDIGDNTYRRRRKCRNPRRQVFDSDSHVGDSDTEDVYTDVEDSIQTPKPQDDHQVSAKIPRIDSQVIVTVSESCLKEFPAVTTSNPDTDVVSISLHDAHPSVPAFSASSTASGVSFVPMHYATVNKYLTPQVSSADLSALVNNQLSTGTKYAITAKSLGLGDIGDLCGILPINTLLGKTLISANDANGSSKFLFANNIGTAVCASGSETTSHSGFSQQMTQCIGSASSTNQNFMLNPNLAAAVAAAISNSSFTFSSGNNPIVNNGPSLTTNIPTLNAPSIALTGPSGEILGTIPIASANPPQNILSSALGSNVVQSSINNSLTTVSVTLPANPITGSSTGLANTLNWLRCATTPVDPTSHQVIITSGNPVALLQSLVTQQQQSVQAQIQKQQPLQPTFSVGPTLALIGTLGLNSPVTCTATGQHPPEATFTSNTGLPTSTSTALPSTLHNNVQSGPVNNNAALVAAALLRSLTNVKQSNHELSDSNIIDSNSYNPPASLTLITNNVPSSVNVVTSTRANIIGFDESPTHGNILTNRIAQSTVNLSGVITSSQTPTVCHTVSTPTQTVPARSSIMLSYPRGGTEMNLLLTPASAHAFGTPHLTPLTAVPAALSFQGLPTSQPTSLTLTSPVLLHTPATSTVIQTTSAISDITTTTSSYMVSSTTPFDQTLRKTDKTLTCVTESGSKVTPNSSQAPISNSDPTSSAIDRILQTIKGCMSANANRESDSKLKIRKNESNGAYQAFTGDEVSSHRANDRKVTGTKFSPINKNGLALENDCVSRPSSTNDRLPLPPLQKGAGESSESSSSIPINKFYRCRYCGKTFNRKFCRERHERLHTGVKPYSCELCDEKFIRLEDKKRHVRSLQHYFSGRGSLRNSGLDDQLDETAGLVTEPSSVLPLLAQTLQGGTNVEPVEKEADEPCNGTDEPNFSSHASENESEGPTATLELDESFNPEENESCTDDLKSDSHLTAYDRSYIIQQDTEDKLREMKPKLEGPSDDLLTNLRLTSKIQINKAKCRVALKETQESINSTSESDYEIIKIPTVVVSNTDDATHSKSTT
ncbi:Transcriptional regulator ovo [Schistosoma japonicum]|uniref:Transcriptional regulator ovo n=1 Tax=Schistosoma japonicum TaxID=6182 RepID=A0A4Z2DNC5_SCHJA|nr:Transcriptional regulator ovo [Schistosoma japonicum]